MAGIVGARWAVIIGVSQYKDTRIAQLRYASADAASFYDWIVSPQGGKFAPSMVKLLTDSDATGVNVKIGFIRRRLKLRLTAPPDAGGEQQPADHEGRAAEGGDHPDPALTGEAQHIEAARKKNEPGQNQGSAQTESREAETMQRQPPRRRAQGMIEVILVAGVTQPSDQAADRP